MGTEMGLEAGWTWVVGLVKTVVEGVGNEWMQEGRESRESESRNGAVARMRMRMVERWEF